MSSVKEYGSQVYGQDQVSVGHLCDSFKYNFWQDIGVHVCSLSMPEMVSLRPTWARKHLPSMVSIPSTPENSFGLLLIIIIIWG